MSKRIQQNFVLSSGYLVEIRFFYSLFDLEGDYGKIIRNSSFSMVFRAGEIVNDSISISNTQLGDFFTQEILDKLVLPYHPVNIWYSRLKIRIASDTLNILSTGKYDFPYKKGLGTPLEMSPSQIYGTYRCRFSNEGSRGQLTLRINKFISPVKLDYFINSLLQTKLFLTDPSSGQEIIQWSFCGLTLNRVFTNIFDEFDEILEKIT